MEKTIDRCMSKLKELAEQANVDGYVEIGSFITKLISTENVEEKVYNLILGYFDNLQVDDMPMYTFLLENGADASWYEFVGFMCDQRGAIKDYFSILTDCFFAQISIEEMRDIEKNSKDVEEFRTLAESKIAEKTLYGQSKRMIENLKAENAQLNAKLDKVMDEINQCKIERQNMFEESLSNKKAFMNYKLEAECLKKESIRNQSILEMFEKKSSKLQEMIRQLNAINGGLIEEKEKNRETIVTLESELDLAKEDSLSKEAEIEVLKRQIKLLEQQIADIRMSSLKTQNNIFEEKKNSGAILQEDSSILMEESADMSSIADDNERVVMTEVKNETEELDYDPEDLIPIENKKKKVVKHSNFFSQLINRYFEKKFEKKSQAEQDNLIFIKLMENEFSKDMVQIVKKALKNNNSMSRLELYKLIISRVDDDDIFRFCGAEL